MEELDLKELFNIFWNKKTEILLIVITFILIGSVYSFFGVTPKYTSYTTMVLAQNGVSEATQTGAITQQDLTINQKLVSTYSVLIKSKTVLNEVRRNLDIENELSYNDLKKLVSVKNESDTEVIRIDVTNVDPNEAARIANEVARVFGEKIVEIYNISNAYIVDRAEATTSPSNVNHPKDIVIFAFIGLVISVAYVLIINMLDNTIKTEEDVEKSTGLLVLASVANYHEENKGGKRK